MDYQEKILDGLNSYLLPCFQPFASVYEEKMKVVYDKLLFYYKLGNQELFDQLVSDEFTHFIFTHPSLLESGRLYVNSFITKNEDEERHGPYEIHFADGSTEKGWFIKNDKHIHIKTKKYVPPLA